MVYLVRLYKFFFNSHLPITKSIKSLFILIDIEKGFHYKYASYTVRKYKDKYYVRYDNFHTRYSTTDINNLQKAMSDIAPIYLWQLVAQEAL